METLDTLKVMIDGWVAQMADARHTTTTDKKGNVWHSPDRMAAVLADLATAYSLLSECKEYNQPDNNNEAIMVDAVKMAELLKSMREYVGRDATRVRTI